MSWLALSQALVEAAATVAFDLSGPLEAVAGAVRRAG
jgi:hypothetical protein